MANNTIQIDSLFTDYADLFANSFISDLNYKSKYVYWIDTRGKTDLFNKPKFITKISSNSDRGISPSYTIKQDLDTLTQLQIGLITPVIELFRRDYKGISTETDYIDRKFAFNNTPNSSQFDLINSTYPNGFYNPNQYSAGIKSIDYTFAGTNPAESERAIDVTITFVFPSFDAIIGANSSGGNDVMKALPSKNNAGSITDPTDWVNKDGALKEGVTRNFLSLITYPPSKKQLESMTDDASRAGTTDIYIPSYFQTFLRLGWRIPDTPEVKELFKTKANFIDGINKKLYDKLLLLNLTTHELNFTEEGILELKVNYIASFETDMMSKSELDFLVSAFNAEMRASAPNVVEEQKKLNRIIEYQNNCKERGDTENYEAQRKELQQTIEDKKNEASEPEQAALSEFYNRFMDHVLKNDIKKIKQIKLSKQLIGRYDSALSSTSKNRDDVIYNEIIRFSNRTGESLTPEDKAEKLADIAKNQEEQRKKDQEEANKDPENPSSFSFGSIFGGFSLSSLFGGSSDSTTKKALNDYADENVFFFSFGQLLDMMLEFMAIEEARASSSSPSKIEKVNIVLGDFYYTQRKSGFSNKVLVPIHAVPITLNSFLVWFKDNITSKQRKNYPLRELLNDLLTGLLVPALKGESIKNGVIGGTYAPFLDYIQHGLTSNNSNFDPSSSPTNCFFIQTNGAVKDSLLDQIVNNTTTRDRVLIYVSLVERGNQGRKFESIFKDRGDGISHFFVGDTKGLIKSIKFKRIDQPGLKEAKATKDGFIPLNQLRDLYNVDITMFGNHYYYPGELIYVHPFVPQIGEPHIKGTVSNIMGIGGYYNIIKSSTVISNDNYETNLECVWNSSGDVQDIDRDTRTRRCEALKIEITSRPSSGGTTSGTFTDMGVGTGTE